MLNRQEVLPQLLAAKAAEKPGHTFLREVDGRSFTLADLDIEVRRWASAFLQLEIATGDPVLTMLPTQAEAYFAWLGLGWVRALEVPVSPQYRGYMLEHMIRDSGAKYMVVSATLLDAVLNVAEACPILETVIVIDGVPPGGQFSLKLMEGDAFVRDCTPAIALTGPEHYDVASIFYTSGTTGPSKGVITPWAQLHATAGGLLPLDSFDETDVAYMPFPVNHAAGKAPFYAMLLCGGALVIRDGFSTWEFLDDVRKYGCTYAMMFAAMAQFLMDQPPGKNDGDNPLRKVMMVPLIPEIDSFRRRFGVEVGTLYNMTETSVPIVTENWNPPNTRSCGRVRPGYQCRIVDEYDEEVAVGAVGELVVRSDRPWILMAGYWNQPQATVKAWRNHWHHTGDACYRDREGYFYFVDRMRDVIRRRGENISSLELEMIVQQHPDVAECAAVGVASEWQEEEVKVVVVPRPESGLSPPALLEFLLPRLPRFMVPRFVEIKPELPKTRTGKVRKVELRETGSEGAWDREASGFQLPK